MGLRLPAGVYEKMRGAFVRRFVLCKTYYLKKDATANLIRFLHTT